MWVRIEFGVGREASFTQDVTSAVGLCWTPDDTKPPPPTRRAALGGGLGGTLERLIAASEHLVGPPLTAGRAPPREWL